jgi:glycosyltransferase involved in cell wall biosynthesis
MKSVFLVHSLRKGGAERLVLELASSINCTSITIISWLDNLEFLEEEYKNIKVISLIEKGEYRWLFSLISSSRKLKSFFKSISPDNVLIFSHSVFWLAFLTQFKTKYVYVIQGFSQLSASRGYKKYIFRLMDMLILRMLKCSIITPTQELAEESKEYFCINRKKLEVIPNGVEVGNLKDLNLRNKEELIITMLGTISEHKGQHFSVDIIKKVSIEFPNIKLKIIGEGSFKSELQNKIDKKGLQHNISLLGRRDDAFNLLHDSDLFLHLSLSEGMPLAVIEAMMCGLPVVAFNVSGVRDVVSDNGYLCDYGDLESIGSRILELLKNKDLRNKMSRSSREIAMKSFSKDKMVLTYNSYLERLI